jgi:hypothetical protein
MGAVLPDDVGGRDAVHVAVIAVKAVGPTWAGCDVGAMLTDDGYIAGRNVTPPVGIVDPFIKGTIEDGQRFWLYLYPRSITSLAHAWSHPAFPDGDRLPAACSSKDASEAWLREFVARSDCPPYDEMLDILNRIAQGETNGAMGDDEDYCYFRLEDDYLHFNGTDAHGEIPAEFWAHAANVVGKPFKVKPEYFSCSC